MINNNNNFSDIGSMSASVYYGDGSNLTGVSGGGGGGTSSTTMFNSIIVPANYDTLPWYKLNTISLSSVTATFTLSNINEINYSTINLVQGETINEVAVYCYSLAAGATASIALYSISLDANGRHYPSTLLTTFGEVSLATTGRKTITGLSYTVPSSPSSAIYYTAILRTGAVGSPALISPSTVNTLSYYGSFNGTLHYRPVTARSLGSFTSFPATITSASFSAYTNITTMPFIGFR
jgi:hypothetical protein